MKVLIITYYWPPAGGSGVQRWLKFVKYLQGFGIEPIVYTVDNAKYPKEDTSLLNEVPANIEVLKQPIWEPTDVFFWKRKSHQKKDISNSTQNGLLSFIRGNFFIPDPKVFWVKPSLKFLKKYLRENNIDVLISTGPPHSMHLIAKKLKEQTTVKWIADFRDPWTEIDYFHQLPLSTRSKRKHQYLERKVIENADKVIVVGKTMKKQFAKISDNAKNKIKVIANGFDGEIENNNVVLDKKFSITHIGLMNSDRNPVSLWKALFDLTKENLDFKNDLEIKLIGKVSNEVKESLKVFDEKNVNYIDYLPHEEVKIHQRKSQVLLLCINNVPSSKGILTGKIFEYLQAKRPIFSVGPSNGDAAEILTKTKTGETFDFKDVNKMKSHVTSLYNQYKNGTLVLGESSIKSYHRINLTKDLSTILKEIL